MACGLVTGCGGGSHRSGEGHSGGLTAGTLLLEAFETLALFLFFAYDYFEVEQGLRSVRVYSIEHVLEHIEALLFIFDERVFLAVADEADTLFGLVDRKQVVFPL